MSTPLPRRSARRLTSFLAMAGAVAAVSVFPMGSAHAGNPGGGGGNGGGGEECSASAKIVALPHHKLSGTFTLKCGQVYNMLQLGGIIGPDGTNHEATKQCASAKICVVRKTIANPAGKQTIYALADPDATHATDSLYGQTGSTTLSCDYAGTGGQIGCPRSQGRY